MRVSASTTTESVARASIPGNEHAPAVARAFVRDVLTGPVAEITPWLASHMDVNGLDLTGVDDAELGRSLEAAAADNLKRVRRPGVEDLAAAPALDRMTTFLETKTVWHPMGV